MLRFYDPTEGRVLVGGRDVRELNPTSLRTHIATVMQEPTLFSRTVAENIGYGVAAADAGDDRAGRGAGLRRRVHRRLPGGYATPVGDRGVQLSGGQRQRLAIARAILRRPKILILDEATSALDAELDSVVQMALRAIDDRPTTLIIAHRLSTVAQGRPRGRPRPGPHRGERHARPADPYLHFLPAARADAARRPMTRRSDGIDRRRRRRRFGPRSAGGCATGCARGFPNPTSAARRWCCTRDGRFRARHRPACAPISMACSRSFTPFWARWRMGRPTARRASASTSEVRSTSSRTAVRTGGRISSNRLTCPSWRATRVERRRLEVHLDGVLTQIRPATAVSPTSSADHWRTCTR